jgi:hypothetical protein
MLILRQPQKTIIGILPAAENDGINMLEHAEDAAE